MRLPPAELLNAQENHHLERRLSLLEFSPSGNADTAALINSEFP
jgi:hypothetical protein